MINSIPSSIRVYLFVIISMAAITPVEATTSCQNVLDSGVRSFRAAIPLDPQNAINASIENLSRLRLAIETAKAQGESSLELTALKYDYQKKENELIKYLEENHLMNRQELHERMMAIISWLQIDQLSASRQQSQISQQERKNEKEALDPVNSSMKIKFNEVNPGLFKMGKEQVETEITRPFAMMSTQLTQMTWARLKIAMGEKDIPRKINPSFSSSLEEGVSVRIGALEMQMQPDHPVVNIDWYEVRKFIDGLNGFSNSDDIKTQELLISLIPDHKKGDIYDLPSEAQWEFVMRNRGQTNKTFFDRDDEAELPDYAWYKRNSGNKTHAVASLKPRIIDGQSFYDLEGNVWEWTNDWHDSKLIGGKNPLGPATSMFRVVRGGGWAYAGDFQSANFRMSWGNEHNNPGLGFRLIRYRP